MMRTFISRASAAVAAVAAVGALGISWASAASAATSAPRPAVTARALAVSGARLWVQRYNGPGNGNDAAAKVAVSPDGKAVYVTGYSAGAGTGPDYATAAYSAATGVRLWLARYNGPANGADTASAVAVSPDGKTVYVTGGSTGTRVDDQGNHLSDFATVAYAAATGARLWVARYESPPNTSASGRLVAVSPDGSRVFVTGSAGLGDQVPGCLDNVYQSVAYNAATGARLWQAARVCGNSTPSALTVGPDGNTVYVTGQQGDECGLCAQYGTFAYNAVTGATIWHRSYGSPGEQAGGASGMGLSPDGKRVYVTGFLSRASGGGDITTVAYGAAGKQLWAKRYINPRNPNGLSFAAALAVSPAGTVVVTGTSLGIGSGRDYATLAYNPAGQQLWAKRYNGPGNKADTPAAAAAPGDGKVYVTGTSWGGTASRNDYATIAYNIFTGNPLWTRRYNGPGNGNDLAASVAARAGRTFVTGGSPGTTSGPDYATIAYRS